MPKKVKEDAKRPLEIQGMVSEEEGQEVNQRELYNSKSKFRQEIDGAEPDVRDF